MSSYSVTIFFDLTEGSLKVQLLMFLWSNMMNLVEKIWASLFIVHWSKYYGYSEVL